MNFLERHSFLVLSIFVLGSIAAITAVAERMLLDAELRIKDVQHERFIRLKEHERKLDLTYNPKESYLESTDSLTPEVFRFRTDANGFILPSAVHREPDLNLVFLGGSTTEAAFVPEKERYPYTVGRKLEEKSGLKINSYNGGVSGANSFHSINTLLNKVVPLKPDVVLLMHNINDLNILIKSKSYWNRHRTRSPLVERNINFGELAKTAGKFFAPNLYRQYQAYQKQRAQTQDQKPKTSVHFLIHSDEIAKEFATNLKLFIEICRSFNIRPVLMTQMSRMTPQPDALVAGIMKGAQQQYGYSYSDYYRAFQRMNETIREVARKQDVLLIDLAKEIPPSEEFIYDLVHLNKTGSQKAANVIFEKLQPISVARKAKSREGNSKIVDLRTWAKQYPFLKDVTQESFWIAASDLPGKVGRNVGEYREAKEAEDEAGLLTYGPYLELPSGDYELRLVYEASGQPKVELASAEALFGRVGQRLGSAVLQANDGQVDLLLNFRVEPEFQHERFELKVKYSGLGTVVLHKLKFLRMFTDTGK